MKSATNLTVGASLGALAVAAGATGAHGIEWQAGAPNESWWELATRYQMYHALGMVLCGILAERGHRLCGADWGMLLGTCLFSGTLFAMALGAPGWLGAITPIGGTLLIAAWVALAFARRQPL